MQLSYEINKEESLSHWLYSGIGCKDVSAPLESFYAPVNMGEAYVQIVYPQRKWFLAHHDLSSIRKHDGNYPYLYFPFEDSKVNFSTAIKTTTHIWTNLKSYLEVPDDDEYQFSVATCGGFKLWVDGSEALMFTPYDRNIPHTKQFTLNLHKGAHTLEIYTDELAERDVFFYFDFTYHGDKTIIQSVETDAEPQLIYEAEQFLLSLSLTRTTYCYGAVEAEFDSSMLTSPVTLYVDNLSSERLAFRVENGMSWLKLLPYFSELCSRKASFCIQIGEVTVKRDILFNLAPRHITRLESHETVEERKAEALAFTATYGGALVHQAMAIIHQNGYVTEEARRYIENSLVQIERKEDCADFVLAPLLWSLIRDSGKYPADLYERAKRAVLDFRYWIDEKGNDAMWYFSENHAFLFHVSQYLAGVLYPDETFTVSGRKGIEQMHIGKSRLITWFRNFSYYHYAEWNSATYFPVDLIGLFSLYEAGNDSELKEKAESALNYTFTMIRDNTFHGIMSSSFGRAYEMTVKAKELNESSFLSYVATGEGEATLSNRAVALFSLSSYIPPETSVEKIGSRMRITTAVNGMDPVWIKNVTTENYTLSSAIAFNPYRHGHQQHIMDCTIGREASFFINHPGEKAYSGENRPAYWAGNGTLPFAMQYKALMVMLFEIEEKEAVKYIHAYFPTWVYDEWSIEGNNVFARSGDGYLGIRCSSLPELTTSGMNRMREIRAEGSRQLAVIRCSDNTETGSYDNFRKLFTEMSISYTPSERNAVVNDFSYGLFEIRESKAFINGEEYEWRSECGYEKKLLER